MWYWAQLDTENNKIKSVCRVYSQPLFSEEKKILGFKEITEEEYISLKQQLLIQVQEEKLLRESMELIEIEEEDKYETISNE